MGGCGSRAARRVGVAPEALALLAGRRRQADAGVVDLCVDENVQLQCARGNPAQRNLPLNLYSVFCFSPKSIDFGGVVPLEVFSATVAGRAFSSCLRKGLRMIGIAGIVWQCRSKSVRERCCSWVAESAKRNVQCDGRQVARRQVVVVVEIEWARAVLGSSQAAISERDPGEEEGKVLS